MDQIIPYLIAVLSVAISGISFAAMSIGQNCRRYMILNCQRLNGTWSRNRFRRELLAFSRYLASLSIPLILALPLSLFVIEIIENRVIPISIVSEALSKFSQGEDTWKESLRELRETHTRWFILQNQAEREEIHQYQQRLWIMWPLLAAIGSCFVVLGVWFSIGLAHSAVQDFASGVRHRRIIYAHRDAEEFRHAGDSPPDTCQLRPTFPLPEPPARTPGVL